MTAREEILARVRGALADVPAAERPADVPVPREYRRSADDLSAPDALFDRLEERLVDYHARVVRVGGAEVGAAVTDACGSLGLRRVAVPTAVPDAWRPSGVEIVDDVGLSAHALDGVDGALTGCAVAIAETGTLVLDGRGACGRRATTLVPDHHICVVLADQVVGLVPEAIARLGPSVRDGAPITLVSGPSASSDIELSRVEGVHGPRQLLVMLVQ